MHTRRGRTGTRTRDEIHWVEIPSQYAFLSLFFYRTDHPCFIQPNPATSKMWFTFVNTFPSVWSSGMTYDVSLTPVISDLCASKHAYGRKLIHLSHPRLTQ